MPGSLTGLASEGRPRDRGPLARAARAARRARSSRSQRRASGLDLDGGRAAGRASRRARPPSSVAHRRDRRRPPRRSSGSPSQPHSTVRSLSSVWKRDAVVDAVPVPVGHRQHVAALAVGVVDDHVEDRHPPQRRGVLVDQRDRLVVPVDAVEDVQPALGHARPRARGRRRPAPRRAPATAGPCPGRAGRRAGRSCGTTFQPSASETTYAAPRGRRGCRRGSPTAALAARPACRRTWTPSISPMNVAFEAGMIRPWTPARPSVRSARSGGGHGSRRRKPLARTHRWPSGSIGLPQNGQLGRPGARGPASARFDERARGARR